MKVKLNFKGRKIEFNAEKAEGIKKYTGLMFKPLDTSALLFDFKSSEQAIHSFFCPDFLAVWIKEGRIIDYKFITPNRPYIKPKEKFSQLLEIPINSEYSQIINIFLEYKEKDLNSISSINL